MKKGFTLVELAIVLVVIGTIVGGILTGQELIKQAKVRTVIKELEDMKTSFATFKLKYDAFPGDMKNAVMFWGAAAGSTADGVDAACNAVTTAAVGTETCNGDGSGLLPNLAVGGDYDEFWRGWQHLSNAGLVAGPFSGVAGSGSTHDAEPGINCPVSKVDGASWTMWSLGAGRYTGASYFPGTYGNLLYYGINSDPSMNYNTALKAEDAYNIDAKVDDGKPQSGNTLSHPYLNRPNCINSTEDAYLVTDNTKGCNLIFKTGY